MTMLPLSNNSVTSPAWALSERSQWERDFLRVTDRNVSEYLSIVSDVTVQLNAVSPTEITSLYVSTVDDIIADLGLDGTTAADTVREQFLNSPLSNEVVDTATYLVDATRAEQVPAAQRRQVLTEGLSFDTATITQNPSLTAAAVPRIIGNVLARAHSRGKRWRDTARQDARTAASGAYNETQYRRLQADSALLHKRWITRRDHLVRHSHAIADGQTIPKASLFQVGAARLLYPGQGTFPYDEVVNCRCTFIGVPAAGARS